MVFHNNGRTRSVEYMIVASVNSFIKAVQLRDVTMKNRLTADRDTKMFVEYVHQETCATVFLFLQKLMLSTLTYQLKSII
jgi:hypothetical protein